MAQRDLRRVAAARERIPAAKAAFREAILRANESGESAQGIAPYAGLSKSRVHELIKEAKAARKKRDAG
jgi:hypothetical protein